MKQLALIFVVLISLNSAFAQGLNLKVVTYNIHDLPWPEKKDRGEVLRIGEIFGEMRASGTQPQVVFLQEAFSSKIKKFVKNSGYKYVAKGPGPGLRIFNSGIYILSDYKILRVAKAAFGFACAGLDCGSNKGVVVAEIEIPGLSETVWVANTHMNSGKASLVKPEKHIASRAKQIAVAAKLFDKLELGDRPIIFGGDFNNSPIRQPWDVLINTLQMDVAQEYCMNNPSTCERLSEESDNDFFYKSPDHVLYRSSQNTVFTPLSVEKTFKILHKGRPISDHHGVEVVFAVQSK